MVTILKMCVFAIKNHWAAQRWQNESSTAHRLFSTSSNFVLPFASSTSSMKAMQQ
jgi:hypothetical protein